MVLLVFAVFMAPSAHAAEELTQEKAGRFVAAIPDIEAFGAALDAEGKYPKLRGITRSDFQCLGETPYVDEIIIIRQEFSEEYKKLEEITVRHGFEGAEEWAATGDRVMHAYRVLKVGEQPQDAEALEAIKAQVPPDVRPLLDKEIEAIRKFSTATEADKAAVKPYEQALDKWLQRAQAAKDAEIQRDMYKEFPGSPPWSATEKAIVKEK